MADNGKFSRSDYLFMGLTVLSLLASCVLLSPKKPFWNDELYSWHLLSDPSFWNMWHAFADSINNSPPLYFLLGWPWVKLFSASELSLRIFTSLGFGLSAVLAWATLRRGGYAFGATALAVVVLFTSSGIIFEQNAEARMYGLYMAAAAWCFFLYDSICREARPGQWLLLWNFAAHAALIHAHLHGAFFSGAMLVAFVLYDVRFASFRPRVYLSVLLSWLTIVLYLPAFFSQSEAGHPRSWLPEPTLRDLANLLFSSNDLLNIKFLALALIFLLIGQAMTKILAPLNHQTQMAPGNRIHMVIYAFAMLAVPVGVWALSKLGRPIFFPRYLMPAIFGYAVLLAHIFEYLFPLLGQRLSRDEPRFYAVAYVALASFLLAQLAVPVLAASKEKNLFSAQKLISPELYPELPVVFQYSGDFNEYYYYSDRPGRYFYVLEEEAAKSWESGRFGYQEHKHMVALQRNYPSYFDGHIIESEEFLRRHDRFLVLDYVQYELACPEFGPVGLDNAYDMLPIHCPQWMERKILGNPEYQVAELADNGWNVLLLVERKQQ